MKNMDWSKLWTYMFLFLAILAGCHCLKCYNCVYDERVGETESNVLNWITDKSESNEKDCVDRVTEVAAHDCKSSDKCMVLRFEQGNASYVARGCNENSRACDSTLNKMVDGKEIEFTTKCCAVEKCNGAGVIKWKPSMLFVCVIMTLVYLY